MRRAVACLALFAALAGTAQAQETNADKWAAVQSRMRVEAPALARCLHGGDCMALVRAPAWRAIVAEARRRSGVDRLAYVNGAINRLIPFYTDVQIYGYRDYWATPVETLRYGGDCEDIAILKIATLQAAGEPADGLQIWLVAGGFHAVTIATAADGRTYVLDNDSPEIVPADRYGDLPVGTLALSNPEPEVARPR